MNWLTSVVRPKIRSLLRREVPESLWVKCPETGQMVFYKDLEANQFVIPGSNYHMRMGASARLKSLFDGETWLDVAVPDVVIDPPIDEPSVRNTSDLRRPPTSRTALAMRPIAS